MSMVNWRHYGAVMDLEIEFGETGLKSGRRQNYYCVLFSVHNFLTGWVNWPRKEGTNGGLSREGGG